MMKHFIAFLSFIYLNQEVSSFSSPQSTRKDFIRQISAGIVSLGSAATVGSSLPNANAAEAGILRSDNCAYGEGTGCEALAGDNEFIKQLQRKSAERKELEKKVRASVLPAVRIVFGEETLTSIKECIFSRNNIVNQSQNSHRNMSALTK